MGGDARAGGDKPGVEHNTAAGRFEIRQGELVAVLEYEIVGNEIAMFHTGVPPELEGRGLGSQLARAALEYARIRGLRVIPQCSFVHTYIARHPEYASLVEG
jgi:uncharacterized protein